MRSNIQQFANNTKYIYKTEIKFVENNICMYIDDIYDKKNKSCAPLP